MRRWYEPRRDRPDLERSAIGKHGFVGYMDMLWREFFELLKLNLLFVLSCVPIITIPAALTAMHRITSVMVRDENHFLWPDYWKAFRRDFWKSLGGGAAIAAVMALFVLSTVFYYNLMQVNKVFVLLAGFAACVVLLTLCVSFYFFPMLAMVDLPLGALLIALYIKNAYNILMFAWSFYAAAAGLPAFAALYWKKATKAGVLSGMAAGFTVTIAWKLLGQPFGLGATVPGAIACALALVLVSLATCKKHPSVYLDPRKA